MEFLRRLSDYLSGQKGSGEFRSIPRDVSVEALDKESTLVLARQTMTLSRRRRCAVDHLGGDLTNEGSVMFALERWYLEHGFTKEAVALQALSDLRAIYEDPVKVSETLKKRILLTNYFSDTGSLEDCYDYGDIEPFIFESEKTGRIGIIDTFYNKLSFAQRVNTVISLNPEVRGFKHQIRYFRTLLTTYGLAYMSNRYGLKDSLIDATFADEKALAVGWLTLDKTMKKYSIDPSQLPPDESLLYNANKVAESASLFKMYTYRSRDLLIHN
jgi:hypothetical protein